MSSYAPTRSVLENIARRVMMERGLSPDFPRAAIAEVDLLSQRPPAIDGSARDLRELLWCSIDNDDSRDLDQLSVAEPLGNGATKLRVAIADVDSLVRRRSAVDGHAEQNTTSIYTVAKVFPMLPEKLSTDLTSLNPAVDRHAMVMEMTVAADGTMTGSDVYAAVVHNRAKLAYNAVAAWFDDGASAPAALAAVPGLAENLRLQDSVAQKFRSLRHTRGALTFETEKARPVFAGEQLTEFAADRPNRAKKLIEDLMVAANGVTAAFLAKRNYPSIRRVVRTPKRWDRIVELATERGAALPNTPDPAALEKFLCVEKVRDPLRFPDLSLSIIKLLGSGEYVLEIPGLAGPGHFGLAVKDYAHSTAPNRRFPDLITQRLLKAAIAKTPAPYANAELERLAAHCTEQEDDARKVERQVAKSAAAMLLANRIGAQFEGIVTGASEKGTWVRIFRPPVEGRLVAGWERKQVGDRLRVKLVHVEIERGFLDFVRV
jgi:VacB/RNase II family 3'-5' exoribonuclease